MAFAFIHTGDWHIAKSFGRFESEMAGQLKAARLGIIDRLATLARDEGAGHVLVAGDIYDHPDINNKALMAPIERMKSSGHIDWHLIPGNHDPGVPGGLWERVMRSELPDNVRVYLEPAPVLIAPNVALLPAPVITRRAGQDTTAWMGDALTGDGVLRIGLAHGPVANFDRSGSGEGVIDPGRAEAAGLDYLALGDWHGHKKITARTWYSGTPEPEQFPDNDPGYVLVVKSDGPGSMPNVTPKEMARYHWQKRQLAVRGTEDVAELVRQIESYGVRAHDTLLELTLSGEVSLEDDAQIALMLERLEARLFHLVRKTDRLRIAPQAEEIEQLDDPAVRSVAMRLRMQAERGDARQSLVAERALRKLFGLVRSVERERG